MSSKNRKAKPQVLPSTGGSFILGADGKLVPNPESDHTQPAEGKSARLVEDPAPTSEPPSVA